MKFHLVEYLIPRLLLVHEEAMSPGARLPADSGTLTQPSSSAPRVSLALFLGLPCLHSSVCIQYNSASVYYTERKLKNESVGGLVTRLESPPRIYLM